MLKTIIQEKNKNPNLMASLYRTKAFHCFENNQPFWYTSGKIGPYYINTHYLFGGKSVAEDLLDKIDSNLKKREELIKYLNEKTYENYINNRIYKRTIDELISKAKTLEKVSDIDYISGGERRDWFFSFPLARCLKKKHITIFKDKTIIIYDCNTGEFISGDRKTLGKNPITSNTNILHITDLVTEASSFEAYWIPALKSINGKIGNCLSVVDRMQGGLEKLSEHNINLESIFQIDQEFFKLALDNKLINNKQYEILLKYIKNPETAMFDFIESNPEFLLNSLNSKDEKISARAKMSIEKEIYKVI